jgi:hypothetical protein
LSRQRLALFPHQNLTVISWIAFEDETATAIDHRIGPGTAEVQSGDPLSIALTLMTQSIVVLPSSTPGKVALALFRRTPQKTTAPSVPLAFEPSGFLGLSDVPVFLDDSPPPPPKQRWWQRKKAA